MATHQRKVFVLTLSSVKVILLGLCVISSSSCTTNLTDIVGYTQRFSVPAGEPLQVMLGNSSSEKVRTESGSFNGYRIYGVHRDEVVVDSETLVEVIPANCESYEKRGCNFPEYLEIPTANLSPGLYYLQLYYTSSNLIELRQTKRIYFNITHSKTAQNLPKTVLLIPTFTWHAYNQTGGKNLYELKDGPMRVSTQRPFEFISEYNFHKPTVAFAQYFRSQNLPYRTIDSVDLHSQPHILDGAETLVLAGHDEYWSHEMFEAAQAFVKRGGNLLVFSGNSVWWKVRYTDGLIEVYKRSEDPSEVFPTGLFSDVGTPEETLIGLSFRYARYPVKRKATFEEVQKELGWTLKQYNRTSAIQVQAAEHPIFADLDLAKEEWIGESIPLQAVELDGLPLNSKKQVNYQAAPFAPKGIRVLATGFASSGCKPTPAKPDCQLVTEAAAIAEFALGAGRVINFGSVGWYKGLDKKVPMVQQIVSNTFRYLEDLKEPTVPAHSSEDTTTSPKPAFGTTSGTISND